MRKVAHAPASAPAINVSAASASRFCIRANSRIIDRVWVKINRFNPENGASRATVLPSPENNPAAPSLFETLASVANNPLDTPALAPWYSIRVFTTVIGFNNTAATDLALAPVANVIIDRSIAVLSGRLSVDASSRVTRSRRQKYNPAPRPVRTHDAETPDQSPRGPDRVTTSVATLNIPRAPRKRSACIFVFTTSNGCNTALETSPAAAPPRNADAELEALVRVVDRAVVRSASTMTREEVTTRRARPTDDDVTTRRAIEAMPPIAHRGAVDLWAVTSDPEPWRAALRSYARRVDGLNRGEALTRLNEKIQTTLPRAIERRRARDDEGDPWWTRGGYITKEEYVDVVSWKLGRGKTRPGLLNYAKALSEESVREASARAFAQASEMSGGGSKKKLGDAMAPLIALRGCGPATASAVMALVDERFPFFSDEALVVVIGNGDRDSERYSLPRYKQFMAALQRRSDELGAPELTPSMLERALWSEAALTIPKKATLKK